MPSVRPTGCASQLPGPGREVADRTPGMPPARAMETLLLSFSQARFASAAAAFSLCPAVPSRTRETRGGRCRRGSTARSQPAPSAPPSRPARERREGGCRPPERSPPFCLNRKRDPPAFPQRYPSPSTCRWSRATRGVPHLESSKQRTSCTTSSRTLSRGRQELPPSQARRAKPRAFGLSREGGRRLRCSDAFWQRKKT